ncbi:hypothetical protein [Rugamonas rivuli]|uniref:Uncharacterized protein n=1 Tax=Rugamonas rivuli TaxID=2743358 RepID=A0A843S877_9BURK|nr:hypothetical protein [Rugamonas rivuli]MQA18450.1 hypothetical protein [Rugamonas rivuli]
MKHIVTRHMVLWLKWMLLLGSLPLPSTAQNLPLQMEMRAGGATVMLSPDVPTADCMSFAFCCIAPPVPVRAFGTPERSNALCVSDAWQREVNDLTAAATSRHIAPSTVALRVLHCCWRN